METLAMTAAEIREAVLAILADIAPDEDISDLKEDVPFRDQLELDSMDFLDIVMELRKRYRIQIPEEEYPELASMGSTVRFLEPRMKDIVKK
jgi:acyl carrier protein